MTRLESDYYSYMDFDPEHTREVLRHYVPMFEDNNPVLELGCGRGEFLGLLDEKGIKAEGVDSDDGMVEAARTKGLDVVCGDAIAFLNGDPGWLLDIHVLARLACLDRDVRMPVIRRRYTHGVN